MRHIPKWSDGASVSAAGAAILLLTAVFRGWHLTNPTIAAVSYLLVVFLTATVSRVRIAVVTCVAADLCLNYFFMPPVGTLTIADPQNLVAFLAFVAVSVIASSLSSALRDRAFEVTAHRDELERLFDLSRDVLLTTDSAEAMPQLARSVARRFDLEFAAVCRPGAGGWDVWRAGALDLEMDRGELSHVLAEADDAVSLGAQGRAYLGHRTLSIDGHVVHLVPLRLGAKAVGLVAAAGRAVDPGTLDALAGVVAIAIERAQLLDERKTAELARQSEELKSALLASISHDLRTPLTAIKVAASNLQAAWLAESDRHDQSELILVEVERLHRLFQNILEMARIDSGAIAANLRWVHPSEIVEAAREQVEIALRHRQIDLRIESDMLIELDPLLTAAALAHVLENAAQYSPSDASIALTVQLSADDLEIAVRDRGPGIAAGDLPHLFDRFYRGAVAGGRTAGTGMGLAIARGMLAAEGGRIRAENREDGGAQFTIAVPAGRKIALVMEQT
jgi:two-component system sensor histidine kinase KdpD